MADVFIAHAEEDGPMALKIVDAFEAKGVSAWTYERNLQPGRPHQVVSAEQIDAASVILLLISPSTYDKPGTSPTVNEACWAQDRGKPIIPLLYRNSHETLKKKSTIWGMIVGPHVAMEITEQNFSGTMEKVLEAVCRITGASPKSPPKGGDDIGMILPLPEFKRPKGITPPPLPRDTKKELPIPPREEPPPAPSLLRSWLVPMAFLVLALLLGLKLLLDQRKVEGVSNGGQASQVEVSGVPKKQPKDGGDSNPTPAVIPTFPVTTAATLKNRLESLEREWRILVRSRSVDKDHQKVRDAINEFNDWSKARKDDLAPEDAALKKGLAEIRSKEQRIPGMKAALEAKKPDVNNAEESVVAQYNKEVAQFNAFMKQIDENGEAYKKAETAYNDRMLHHNKMAEAKHAEVERLKSEVETQVNTLSKWNRERGAESFWEDLNRCYADLHIMSRKGTGDAAEVRQLIERVQEMRRDLGQQFQREQDATADGFLVGKVNLCGKEDCYLTIDNGATISFITDEMVDVLDLRKFVGGTAELMLPNAIKIKAPQLLIPNASVMGQDAWFIKAVVLKSSICGVDGSLGLSFLSRYDYNIRGGGNRLELRPRNTGDHTLSHDIFLCHDPEDAQHARGVYDVLKAGGGRPYLRNLSQQEQSEATQQRQTDETLVDAPWLVLIASSADHAHRPWVEAEWGLFDHMRRQGSKKGTVICLAVGDMMKSDFPGSLQKFPIISTQEPNWQAQLTQHLGF